MTANKIYRLEADVKKVVKKLLTQHEWKWWMPANNGYGASGTLDFCTVKQGLFLAIETKLGKNQPTVQQHAFARDVRLHGAWALLVNEHRLDYLATWLAVHASGRDMHNHALTDVLSSGIG